jgi:HK97 family phage major capsid protein
MNEENMQKLFDEIATKAPASDVVTKAEWETLQTELVDVREQLARKSQTKSQTIDTSADDDRLARLAFVKGNHAVLDGDMKATEFSRTVNVEGGHTIPTFFDTEITRGLSKTSIIRSLSRVVGVKGNMERLIKIRASGAAALKTEKGAYNLNTTDTFAKLHWNFTDIVDQQRHSSWVSDDQESILNLADELKDSMVLNIAEKESDLFLNGATANSVDDVTGVTTTKIGLLQQTLLNTNVNKFTDSFGKLAVVEVLASAKLSDAILILRSTLHSNYLPGSVLVISSDFELKVMQEKDANGRPVWMPADASVAGLFAGTVYGIRYVVDDVMPTVAESITAAKPAALLADFGKAYTIADYQTMKWVVDPITEPQYVKYSARRRVGAAIVDYKAIRGLVIKPVV